MDPLVQTYFKLEEEAPERLHHLIGVNCFHHASGFSTPIVLCYSTGDTSMRLLYMNLMPSPLDFPFKKEINDLDEFNHRILLCCEKEKGLIPTGGFFRQRDGYRSLAILTGSVPVGAIGFDVHFAYFNPETRLWEEKVPDKPITTSGSLEEIATRANMNILGYCLIKDGYVPSILDSLDFEEINLAPDSRDPMKIIVLKQTDILRNIPFFCEYHAEGASLEIIGGRVVPAPPLGEIMSRGLYHYEEERILGAWESPLNLGY